MAEVLGIQSAHSGRSSGLDDQGIPEGNLKPALYKERLQNGLPGIHHHVPAQIISNDPGRLFAGQWALGLAADIDVKLLKYLGAQHPRALDPEMLDEGFGSLVLLPAPPVVGIDQEIAVQEAPIGHA